MLVRGIRGATTIKTDTVEEVLQATRELLEQICNDNDLKTEDIASALFTVTADIRSAFPAAAARSMGWDKVPLLCFQEIEVHNALPRCIRVLVHVNTEKSQEEIRHVYMKDAQSLRTDLQR
ncbi:MAG: chorismate mutase [Syntrophomonadaceae bacterium]|nr:chorismate mutase [Syntrophomonadaceae bacterium]